MKIKGLIKITLIFLFSIFIHISSSAQNRKYFVINGNIKSAFPNADNCSMQIIRNNSKTFNSQIPENGRFRLELDYNKNFTLIFQKKGHQPKTIQVNTEIPEEVMLRPENFPNFLMTVSLIEGDENSTVEVQEIVYSPQEDSFCKIQNYSGYEIVDQGSQNLNNQAKATKSKTTSNQVF